MMKLSQDQNIVFVCLIISIIFTCGSLSPYGMLHVHGLGCLDMSINSIKLGLNHGHQTSDLEGQCSADILTFQLLFN